MHALLHRNPHSTWWAMRLSAALAAGACASLATGVPEAQASETREFSSQEEALLRAGKLVTRPEQLTRRGTRLLGGTSWQLIDAEASEVWRALRDVESYPHFLPAVDEARLLDSSGETQTIYIHHHLGFMRAGYAVRVLQDDARTSLRFRLDREYPASIRDAWGELRVTPYGAGKCVASLAIMADLGEGPFVGLVRSNVHAWMLRVPELLKRYLASQQQRH
jgi:ribosome-associated toxin RatA of RatAB toxin-antitoxin module